MDAGLQRLKQEQIDASHMIDQARALVAEGDLPGLARIATRLWRKTKISVNALGDVADKITAEMDPLCDAATPPPVVQGGMAAGSEARLRLAAELLDGPWPTPRRVAALLSFIDGDVARPRRARLDRLAEEALAAPSSAVRTRLLRLIVGTRLGFTEAETGARVLAALHEVDALDADVVEGAFTRDAADAGRRSLGDAVLDAGEPVGSAGFRAALRELYDELVWRLTATPNPDDWCVTPTSPAPRGLRFVLRGLDLSAGRLAAVPGLYERDPYIEEMVAHLCAAELTDDERDELVSVLRQRPDPERHVAAEHQPLLAAAVSPTPVPEQSPAYAVPGVVPERAEGRSVRYRGDQLQATDAVAAALDRAPQVWPALFDYDDEDEFGTITRDNLCGLLYLSTQDGTAWDLGLEEEITGIVHIEPDRGEDDLIEQALAAQPDVAHARHADVDWFQVGTARPLPADEMLARFIDALAAAHRQSAQKQPVSHPVEPLDPRTLSALATEVAAMMAEHGFAGLRVDLANGQASPEYGLHGFYRTCDEPLVHTVRLLAGSGVVYGGDGADGDLDLEGTVTVTLSVRDISTLDPTASIVGEVAGREYVKGFEVGYWNRHAAPPSAAALVPMLIEECLPWFDTVSSRAAIVNQWVRDPHAQPPWHLPEKIEVAARWDMRDEASALLRYGRLEQPQYEPQFAAVAEKFQLQTAW